MPLQKNIYLLKEYIKTLIATEVIFPGVLPRSLGHEFSPSEHEAIYFALKFVIRKAHPHQDSDMINAFGQIDDPTTEIHWFLSDYWRDLVALLVQYPDLADDYLSNLN
ncbi:hypothetical protein GO755_39755 [Spirosoma sp. HMF4905]|uniref:Uncharacterized protein n=1 Tax=Spirosoma arboris TaxID=2682092 RepID=A0A7K1SR87_9BACT|nr:hypothetical protein [Spirosoma arboris]MVM36213.1 hypothetical protein [Spirosoma arboris]